MYFLLFSILFLDRYISSQILLRLKNVSLPYLLSFYVTWSVGCCCFFSRCWFFILYHVIPGCLFICENDDRVDDWMELMWGSCELLQALGMSRLASLQAGLEGNWLPVRLRSSTYRIRRALPCTKSNHNAHSSYAICFIYLEEVLVYFLIWDETRLPRLRVRVGQMALPVLLKPSNCPLLSFPLMFHSGIPFLLSPHWEPLLCLSGEWALPYLEALKPTWMSLDDFHSLSLCGYEFVSL